MLTKCRLYRASIVFEIERDLLSELEWLNPISLKYLKNYQIWYLKPLEQPNLATPTNPLWQASPSDNHGPY